MLRILALVAVLLIALLGYSLGMDGGMITLLIVILGTLMFVLGHLQQKYGTKKLLGGMVNGLLSVYDPTLPLLSSDDDPYNSAPAAHEYIGTDGVVAHPTAHSEPKIRPFNISDERLHTTIQQVAGPNMHGMLAPGVLGRTASPVQPGYVPLTPVNQYELHLGPNAYVDVSAAFINALLLDPQGHLPRVLAEELASKGVPILFVDVAGTFASLLAEFPLGWRICSPMTLKEDTVDPRAIPLDRESKEEALYVGRTILQEGWQVLFQFSSYSSSIDAAITLWDLIQGMAEWERAQQRQSGRFLPSVVFITEAYRFCSDANQHSICKEIPDVAQAVRQNLIMSLKAQGKDGMFWYLATRKVTGMEPQALRQCTLWMIQQPSVAEVNAGWITTYTGLEPQELQRVPPTHTLIMDTTTRAPQMVAFRESRSHSRESCNTYTLPSLPTVVQSHQESVTPPFLQR